MKVLIANDFAIIRDGLKSRLDRQFGNTAVGEAATAEELLVQLATQSWDVLLLDVHLPGSRGTDVLNAVRMRYPQLPILFISFDTQCPYAVQSFKAGATGYLAREDVSENLPAAINKIRDGGRYISARIAEKLADTFNKNVSSVDLSELLSARELAIMSRLVQGITPKHIAFELGLSIKTISTYRGRALRKMNMQSNVEFLRYVIKNNLSL